MSNRTQNDAFSKNHKLYLQDIMIKTYFIETGHKEFCDYLINHFE